MTISDDDDSWEVAAQTALDIHRRVISAVRNRATPSRAPKKVRPSSTSRSSDAAAIKRRPLSAPTARSSNRRRYHRNNGHDDTNNSSTITGGPVLVPNLGSVYTGDITPAELQAWATLSKTNFEDDSIPINEVRTRRRHQKLRGLRGDAQGEARIPSNEIDAATTCYNNRSTTTDGSTPARSTPSSAKISQRVDDARIEHLRILGRTAKPPITPGHRRRQKEDGGGTSTLLSTNTNRQSELGSCLAASLGRRKVEDSHVVGGCKRRPQSAGLRRRQPPLARDLDNCRMALAGHLAVRGREGVHNRSDASIGYLREHARKTMEEEKEFLKTLRMEAKAQEDSQIESIHKATQWSRNLGIDVVYVPHRVGGENAQKLRVLKIENSSVRLSTERRDPSRALENYGKVISVDHFMKTDHARLEREFNSLRRGRIVGSDGGETANSRSTQPTPQSDRISRRKGQSRQGHTQRRPNASESRRELHRLIQDTVSLVKALTEQAVELEGQGWNRAVGR